MDVRLKVRSKLLRRTEKLLEVEPRAVEEPELELRADDEFGGFIFATRGELAVVLRRDILFWVESTQSNLLSTVMGSMTRSYCGGRYGPRSSSVMSQMSLTASSCVLTSWTDVTVQVSPCRLTRLRPYVSRSGD